MSRKGAIEHSEISKKDDMTELMVRRKIEIVKGRKETLTGLECDKECELLKVTMLSQTEVRLATIAKGYGKG